MSSSANSTEHSGLGRDIFERYCAICHGADAKGKDREAVGLKTPPPDLTRISARRNGVWPILEVMSIIDGYTKSTNPREDMPVIVELSEGPLVEYETGNGLPVQIPKSLLRVADYLESIQSPRPETYVP